MLEENKIIAKNVGAAVAKYRRLAGLSQAQVAEKLDVSNDAISKMERGSIVLNVPRLFEFAEMFGCEPADFLQNTHRLADQSRQFEALLAKLSSEERATLLKIVEEMIDWKRAK